MKRIIALAALALAGCTKEPAEIATGPAEAVAQTMINGVQEMMKPVEQAAVDGINAHVETVMAREAARREAAKGSFEIVTESGRVLKGKGGLDDGIRLENGQ